MEDLIGLGGLDKADNVYVVDKDHSKYDEEDLTQNGQPSAFVARAATRRVLASIL
jgi:hypothetical protein